MSGIYWALNTSDVARNEQHFIKCLDQRSAHSSEGVNFDPDFRIML